MAESTKEKSKILVTLRRSIIGEKPKTRQTVKGLGLGKMDSTVELPDNESVRGMIHAVRHLVEVADGRQTPDARRQTKKKTSETRRERRRAKKNEDE